MQITIFTSIFESRPNMELEIGRSLLQQQKKSGLSEQEGPGGPPPSTNLPTQISADQLTLFQPGGTDYAHLITTGTPGFSDLPTALYSCDKFVIYLEIRNEEIFKKHCVAILYLVFS